MCWTVRFALLLDELSGAGGFWDHRKLRSVVFLLTGQQRQAYYARGHAVATAIFQPDYLLQHLWSLERVQKKCPQIAPVTDFGRRTCIRCCARSTVM